VISYDEVGTIEVALRRVLPAQMIWMISASLYTMLKRIVHQTPWACVHLKIMAVNGKSKIL
jgi:hypothetical protein